MFFSCTYKPNTIHHFELIYYYQKLGNGTLGGSIVGHCPESITRQPNCSKSCGFFAQMFLVLILTTVQNFKFFEKGRGSVGGFITGHINKKKSFITARD